MNKDLIRSLEALSRKAGGAHLTLEARDKAYSDFGKAMLAANIQIRSAKQIGGRELRVYAAHLRTSVKSAGTRQNRMAAIRVALTEVGKGSLAKDPNYSNRALSLGTRSRNGTKTAASPEKLASVQEKLVDLGRDWIAAATEQEVSLGLRGAEAVCVPEFRLKMWLEQLATDGRIQVIEATKGGRPRFVQPPDIERAVAAVRVALSIAKANGGYLAQRKDGTPATSKKSALQMYSSCLNRLGFQGHSLRYSFTRTHVVSGLAEGMTEKQALALASLSLGHGDGRGRYVKQVYLK